MDKIFVCIFIAAAVACAGAIVFVVGPSVPLLIGFVIAAAIAWLVLTWYHADNGPVFGPDGPERVTFKAVLAGAINDARELFERVTNLTAVGLLGLDAVIIQTPEIKAAVLSTPYGIAAVIALNLFTRLTPRRSDDAPSIEIGGPLRVTAR
jgi:hypothetical protein